MRTDAEGDRVRVLQVAAGERACGIETGRADDEHRPLQQDMVNAPAGEWPGYFLLFRGRWQAGRKSYQQRGGKLRKKWGNIEVEVRKSAEPDG